MTGTRYSSASPPRGIDLTTHRKINGATSQFLCINLSSTTRCQQTDALLLISEPVNNLAIKIEYIFIYIATHLTHFLINNYINKE